MDRFFIIFIFYFLGAIFYLSECHPMSLFLFVILMESLSKKIFSLLDGGLLTGFMLGPGVVDLLLFLIFCLQMIP